MTISKLEKLEPKKRRNGAISDESIERELRKHEGLMYIAAKKLGVTVQAISERVKRTPYLQQVIKECLELRLDDAELHLQYKVRDKDLGAICFLLRTQGKHRGYAQGIEAIINVKEIDDSNKELAQFNKNMMELRLYQARKMLDISDTTLERSATVTGEDCADKGKSS